MMEVQHLSGFEAAVIQNFLQIAVEKLVSKQQKKKNCTLGIFKSRAKEMCIMAPLWSFTISLKIFLHR